MTYYGEMCIEITHDYAEKYGLTLSNQYFDNDVLIRTIYRDNEGKYFYVDEN